jgi:23S rRNA G2445 N2-methylase RlmL
MVHHGLEDIASEEIHRDLGGEIKKISPGIVVFRLNDIDERILRLRTTEDVYLFAWGTDELTHRAGDLESIERWTAKRVDWDALMKIHHTIRPRPKGRPTYRLVAQMEGKHAYLRKDAGKSLARGLAGVFPDSWNPAEENAGVEVWLTIENSTAVCGMRLSDRSMRHRTYKLEHRPASLRPTIAAAMVHLAEPRPGFVVVDAMCGAGTILAEQSSYNERFRGAAMTVTGGDIDFQAVKAAEFNLRRLGGPVLSWWDARRLPIANDSVDRIISNPPFGKQLASPAEIGPLYQAMVAEYDRVLKPGGRAVLLVSDMEALRNGTAKVGWSLEKQLRVIVLGQPAKISVWRKRS